MSGRMRKWSQDSGWLGSALREHVACLGDRRHSLGSLGLGHARRTSGVEEPGLRGEASACVAGAVAGRARDALRSCWETPRAFLGGTSWTSSVLATSSRRPFSAPARGSLLPAPAGARVRAPVPVQPRAVTETAGSSTETVSTHLLAEPLSPWYLSTANKCPLDGLCPHVQINLHAYLPHQPVPCIHCPGPEELLNHGRQDAPREARPSARVPGIAMEDPAASRGPEPPDIPGVGGEGQSRFSPGHRLGRAERCSFSHGPWALSTPWAQCLPPATLRPHGSPLLRGKVSS